MTTSTERAITADMENTNKDFNWLETDPVTKKVSKGVPIFTEEFCEYVDIQLLSGDLRRLEDKSSIIAKALFDFLWNEVPGTVFDQLAVLMNEADRG